MDFSGERNPLKALKTMCYDGWTSMLIRKKDSVKIFQNHIEDSTFVFQNSFIFKSDEYAMSDVKIKGFSMHGGSEFFVGLNNMVK